jgi:hypothetical protein
MLSYRQTRELRLRPRDRPRHPRDTRVAWSQGAPRVPEPEERRGAARAKARRFPGPA